MLVRAGTDTNRDQRFVLLKPTENGGPWPRKRGTQYTTLVMSRFTGSSAGASPVEILNGPGNLPVSRETSEFKKALGRIHYLSLSGT